MTLSPLFDAPFVIQLHVCAAIAAAVLGGFVLWRRKGTRLHKALGRVWVFLMLLVAGSSFFIHTIRLWGPFSPIHILSVVTVATLALAIWRIRSGNVEGHGAAMRGLYVGALGIAGFFTLLPGRLMSTVVFGPGADARAVLIGMGAIAAAALVVFAGLRLAGRRRAGPAPLVLAAPVAAFCTAFRPVPADAASGGDVTALGIVAHTPVWVWAVFVLVVWLGYSRTRDRVVPAWRLVLLPLVVFAFVVSEVVAEGGATSVLVSVALGAILGIGAGLAIGDHGRAEYLGDGRLKLAGEWLSLSIVLLLFAVHYGAGVLAALAPALAMRPVFHGAVAAVTGFSAALLLVRNALRLSVLAR